MSERRIAVGDELPPFVVESVPAEKMKLMAALLRDPNPIHFDAAAAHALGLGDRVVNQGTINLSYLAEVVLRWAEPATLQSLDVRFLGNVFANDRLECRGHVTALDEAGLVTVELEASAGDRVVVSGSAVVAPG